MELSVLQLARVYWNNKWPDQLISNVMFFGGIKITREVFEGESK